MNKKKNQNFHDDVNRYEAWFQKYNELFNSELQTLKEIMVPNKKSLEIGVGTGLFAERLQIAEGVEPSKSMGAIAQARGIKVHACMAENLPFPNESYEQVFMITADCFLKNLPKALQEILRILVDNGTFIIAFLDRETPIGKVYEEKKASDPFYKNAHFRSAEEMIALLIESGFQIEKERQTVFTYSNVFQLPKPGHGEGVFAVCKAIKTYSGI